MKTPETIPANMWMKLVLISAMFAIIAGLTGFLVFKPAIAHDAIDERRADIAERASRQRRLFQDVGQIHWSAERTLLRRVAALETVDVTETFNQLFPLRADGTRRSIPQLFDGEARASGDEIYGMGVYIRHGADVSLAEKRLLLAAFQTVRQHGAAMYGQFDNFYFHTPSDNLVIFGPGREDRLRFYRETAPADFSLQTENISGAISLEGNPRGDVVCTGLARIIHQTEGLAMMTGCHLPVRERGVHLGAFGTSVQMQNYLANAVVDRPEGEHNFILTRDGGIVAHEDFLFLDELPPELVAQTAETVGASELLTLIGRDGQESGTILDSQGRLISYARLNEPGWVFVNIASDREILSKALTMSAFIALFAFLGMMAQLLALMVSFGAFRAFFESLTLSDREAEYEAG